MICYTNHINFYINSSCNMHNTDVFSLKLLIQMIKVDCIKATSGVNLKQAARSIYYVSLKSHQGATACITLGHHKMPLLLLLLLNLPDAFSAFQPPNNKRLYLDQLFTQRATIDLPKLVLHVCSRQYYI